MTTSRAKMKCLTIVAELVVEQRILDNLVDCGARGWTVTSARGAGPSHRQISDFEGGNSRIDVIVDEATANKVWQLLERDYFPNFAVTAWLTDVEVARPERYESVSD